MIRPTRKTEMPELVSPTGKDIPVPPTHANRGVEAAYRRRLQRMVDEMQASIVYWLKAAYRANTPELAMDDSPAAQLNRAMNRLGRQWQRKFNRASRPASEKFADESM